MGELEDYYVIRSWVKYDDDPLKIGRVKCNIPGVIDAENTKKEAIPWCRPYRMHGYQTFSRPLVGELVWVLISKTNYNEFWWTYFHETIDITQNFLNEYYDHQPDVFHARNCSKVVMSTFDDIRGYNTKVGEDYINLGMNREMTISCNDCKMMVKGNKVFCGAGTSGYEPTIMGDKCQEMRTTMKGDFEQLAEKAAADPHTQQLSVHFQNIANALKSEIKTTTLQVN